MYYRPLINLLLHTLMCAVSIIQTFALLHFFDLKEPAQNWVISSLVVVIYLFSIGVHRMRDNVKNLIQFNEESQSEIHRLRHDKYQLQEKIRKYQLQEKFRKLKKNV